MQASAAVLAMPKSTRIAWVPVHSCLSVSEISDHQAKLGVAETQPDNALEQATRSAPIRRPNRPHHYPHEQLKEMYTSLPDDHMEKSFFQSERTDLARFRSGHYHAQRRSQQLMEISVSAVHRLCGENVNLLNTYGYDVRRFWSNDTISPMAMPWTNTSAFHV